MKARIQIAAPLMLAATAALAATGFTYTHPVSPTDAPLGTHPYVAPGTGNANDNWVAPAPNEAPLSPASTIDETLATPALPHRADRSVEITAPRPSPDELLRNAVMDRLASDRALGGKIGVEAYRHTVSLTGRVTTTGQIERAVMLTRSVDGVRDVNNYLLARVGMS